MKSPSDDDCSAVTVIGLGAMGTVLATTFLDAGHRVTVWNRSPGRADALVARGATLASFLGHAVSASELLVVCVLDDQAARELLEPVAGELRGRVVVNLSTGTPNEARELARWVSDCGADYLDGVVMAVPAMIATPEAMILYGGSKAAFQAHRRTLEELTANSPFLGADAGLPALYDAGLLSLLYATMTGWLQAFALVGTADVRAATFLPYAQAWFDHVVAVGAAEVADDIDRGDYPDTVPSSVGLNGAALRLLVRTSNEVGVDAGLLEAIRALAERRIADGHRDDGYTSLIEAIRHPSPV